MISDEVFRNALDVAYKKQGLIKSTRERWIKLALNEPLERRDIILDGAEQVVREKELQKKESKKIPSEFEEQCNFIHWFKKTYPDIVIMSIRNGGSRTPRERVDQMREGLHPGAADLYVPKWHLWIEFKRVKDGILSEEQIRFRHYVTTKCGDSWCLAEGCEKGKELILNFKGKT